MPKSYFSLFPCNFGNLQVIKVIPQMQWKDAEWLALKQPFNRNLLTNCCGECYTDTEDTSTLEVGT